MSKTTKFVPKLSIARMETTSITQQISSHTGNSTSVCDPSKDISQSDFDTEKQQPSCLAQSNLGHQDEMSQICLFSIADSHKQNVTGPPQEDVEISSELAQMNTEERRKVNILYHAELKRVYCANIVLLNRYQQLINEKQDLTVQHNQLHVSSKPYIFTWTNS